MDRILQALQRSRQEDGLARPRPAMAPQPEPTPLPMPESPVRGHGSGPRPRSDGPIVYTRTRTIVVPDTLLRANRVITPWERGAAVDAYRVLSTQVLQRLRENRWNAVALVSAGFREGKTLTAVNLAISLSKEVGHTVLLVDADLRRPGVHRYFGVPAEPGLSEHLRDNVPLDEILFNPGITGLVVLPGGAPLANSSELLGSPRMQALVQELKRRYPSRVVLFDLPPVLSAADALAFSPYVDATIMVVEEGRTSAEDVVRAAAMLESTNLIGTVLNNSHRSGLHVEGPTASVVGVQYEQARARDAKRDLHAQAGEPSGVRRGGWLARLLRRKG